MITSEGVRLSITAICLLVILSISSIAQVATVKETTQVFPTYPFSDPNPVARMSNIYPYFRFDGYSLTSTPKEWKIVELENPYIKVLVCPDMGGKILGAFEELSGKPFIYFNKVIKFREIAMRGPWTSGGIEFNFGDIGHTPTTATSVDYLIRTNNDGSVSCIVGTKDLASRTEWRVEIRMPKDKAYFETRSFWYNTTDVNTSLYHWVCGSGSADDDLHFEYPGTAYIGHGGELYSYPIDKEGRDISYYANNAFGSNKSFHVLGYYTDFFGASWKNDNPGEIHWSLYTDKPGKKIWQWAHSREGAIWTDLLTDPQHGNEQYMEIQSGLLFNQAASSSGMTPLKHEFFEPNSEQRFTEAWFPFWNLSDIADANLHGVLSVKKNGRILSFGVCPVEKIDDNLVVKVSGMQIYSHKLSLNPLQVFKDSLVLKESGDFEVTLGNRLLSYGSKDAEERKLSRPLTANPEFDWNSAVGLATDGTEHARQRDYQGALEKFTESLKKDPTYSPSLTGAADCYYRRIEYEKAISFAQKALANDTYDPDANFVYGLASRAVGRKYDAMDAFGLASRSVKYRSAANTQLAEIAFVGGRLENAKMYVDRALDYDRYNVRANRLLAIVCRQSGKAQEAARILSGMLDADPLCHFARFEEYLASGNAGDLNVLRSLIRDELPHETYLELAAYYAGLGLTKDAIVLLQNSTTHPMVEFWLAYLLTKDGDASGGRTHLNNAIEASPKLVFPFRTEDAKVLEWANQQSPGWKTKYYLGLVYGSKDRTDLMNRYLADCGNTPDFAPFYLTRGSIFLASNSTEAEKDFLRAAALDHNEWRAIRSLAELYNKLGAYDKAAAVLKPALTKFNGNYVLQFDYVLALLYSRHYANCVALLDSIAILPYEGAGYGREAYHQACVLTALEFMKKKEWAQGQKFVQKARLWPENLGVGKPYEVDERLEDYLESVCLARMGDATRGDALLQKVMKAQGGRSYALLNAFALRSVGKSGEARELVNREFPANQVSKAGSWCLSVFKGEKKTLESLEREFETARSKGQWNPVPADPNFLLVYETIRALGQ